MASASAGSACGCGAGRDNPRVEITLSLMTPYLAYWVPEHLGGSGVLATVAAGLYVSWNGPLLIPAATRLQGIFFWDLIIYLIEGFVFLVTGLQARTLLERRPHDFPLRDLLVATADHRGDRDRGALRLGVSGDLSAALAESRRSRRRDPSPPWQMAVRARLHRRARRGLARRGAGDSAHDRERRAVSASRPDPVRHLRRHHHHAGRPGTDAAGRDPLARAWPARTRRAARASRRPSLRRARRRSDAAREHLEEIAAERQLAGEIARDYSAPATSTASGNSRRTSTTGLN